MEGEEDNKKVREMKREDKGKGKMNPREEELEERRKRARERIEFLSRKEGSFDRIMEEVKQNPEKGPLEKIIITEFIEKARSDIKDQKQDKATEHKKKKRKTHQETIIIKKRFESYQEKKTKKSKKIDFEKMGLHPPPPIPSDLMEKIKSRGGSDWKLVIMKQIFGTDLNPNHGRFSIPENQVEESNFLEDHEKEFLSKRGKIKVSFIEPCGLDSEMTFRLWKMNNTFIYALTSNWKDVFKREENEELLKENDIVQLWSFRVKGKLCFALINVKVGTGDGSADAAKRGDHGASSSHSTVVDG